jgi:predicted Zn-ribbon and HTH transcriptional regulator
MSTHRQRLMELLSQGTYTLQELSGEAHISTKEVLHHLEHVRKSVRPPLKFVVEPAMCLNCGFVFKERRKLHSPSKCPRCRQSHIKEPAYRIE